uniref:Uncharacterized protein n=1 Tax=Tetradesmus obliquus TaxID=3088 RepID=A0A383VJB6_TETOB|eukprot:jgi/Sobl393_1/11218/SZX65033.1
MPVASHPCLQGRRTATKALLDAISAALSNEGRSSISLKRQQHHKGRWKITVCLNKGGMEAAGTGTTPLMQWGGSDSAAGARQALEKFAACLRGVAHPERVEALVRVIYTLLAEADGDVAMA